jgi:hypothetical protein
VVVGFHNTNYKERHSHSKMVKLGLAPSRARDVVWEMEYDLQQIWGATVSNHYKAYAILIPNKQNKWLVFWCWTASKEEIEPPAPGQIILPVSDILARVTNETEQASNIKAFGIAHLIYSVAPLQIT